MNPRWREIAVTCWDERTDGLHFDQEKFAGLIVRECIRICMRDYTGILSAPQAPWIVEQLKQHFGIDE